MAKYTFENIMYGEKYNIESDVFMAAYELVKQGVKPTNIREQLREFYVLPSISHPKESCCHTTSAMTKKR